MNKLKVVTLMAFVALIALNGCKDDDEPQSKTGILTSKTWRLTKVEETIDGSLVNATDEWLRPCDNDDQIKFKSGNVYEESPGADDCDGDDEVYTGTWSLSNDEKEISMTIDGDTETYNVISLDNSKLVVETDEFVDDWDGDGDEETVKVKFTISAI